MRIGAVLLAALAATWLVVICTAPFLPAPLAGIVYAVGSLVCHQLPERSFHLAALQLPVCARCTGIYAGGALAAIIWIASGRTPAGALVRSRAVLFWICAAAALPTVSTVAFERLGLWGASNSVRAVAGIPLGAVLMTVVLSVLVLQTAPVWVSRSPRGASTPQRNATVGRLH